MPRVHRYDPLTAWKNPFKAARYELSTDKTKRGWGLRFYGVEWEVEFNDSNKAASVTTALEVACHQQEFAIVKMDGSLHMGVEICSVPATLSYHQGGAAGQTFHVKGKLSSAQSPWEPIYKILNGNIIPGARTAGVHIHVNLLSMTPLLQQKLFQFINSDKNAKFVTFLSGRPFGNYNHQFSPTPKTTLYGSNSSHYLSVNIGHLHTTEIRIFRSAHNHTEIIGDIEFVDALLHFLQSTSLLRVSHLDFLLWFWSNAQNSMLYPRLHNNLVEMFGPLHVHQVIGNTHKLSLHKDISKVNLEFLKVFNALRSRIKLTPINNNHDLKTWHTIGQTKNIPHKRITTGDVVVHLNSVQPEPPEDPDYNIIDIIDIPPLRVP